MLSSTLPKLERQVESYRAVVARAGDKPVIFRTLDIGGDKVLHYLRQPKEENPAMGWRAVRMGLDRPALLRTQIRALLRAAAGHELRIMIPMVSMAQEMDEVRALVEKERAIVAGKGYEAPKRIAIGAMIEVPCLLFELDALLKKVDFVSVGSNDLMQFMFAADRTNARVGSRYDALSPAPLRALKALVKAANKHRVPLNLCGEMAGRPIEALALIALGFRSLSMAPASIGPVKTMILSLDAGRAAKLLDDLLKKGARNIREQLDAFAKSEGIEA
jgi:phosphotransferase system enzyme I (PtsP)